MQIRLTASDVVNIENIPHKETLRKLIFSYRLK